MRPDIKAELIEITRKRRDIMKRYNSTLVMDGMYENPEGAFVYYDEAKAEIARLRELLDSTLAQLHATQEDRDKAMVHIGKYALRANGNRVIICHEDGESGTFDNPGTLEAYLDAFWDKEF